MWLVNEKSQLHVHSWAHAYTFDIQFIKQEGMNYFGGHSSCKQHGISKHWQTMHLPSVHKVLCILFLSTSHTLCDGSIACYILPCVSSYYMSHVTQHHCKGWIEHVTVASTNAAWRECLTTNKQFCILHAWVIEITTQVWPQQGPQRTCIIMCSPCIQ